MSFQIKYVYDLVDKISPQLKTIQANLQATASAVTTSAGSMVKSFDNVGNSLKNTGQLLRSASAALAPASIAMGAIGIKALSSSANLETLAIQLEILTGSAEKGKKLFTDLSQYAAQTPFQLPEIVQGTRLLLGANIALGDIMPTIKMLGDVSAGSGADINGLARVFGQVSGATRLLGQDANQFIQNGIPIWALLQKATGKSIQVLKKMGEQGKISFKDVEEALKKATLQGGMYYQATDKLSKSLSGLYSTLKDNVNLAFADLGDEMVKAADIKQLTKDLSSFAAKVTSAFKSLSPEMKKFITYSVLIGTALAPVLFGFGSLLAVLGLSAVAIGALASPIGAIVLGVTALGVAFVVLKDDMEIIYDFVKDKLVSVFDYLANKIQTALNLFSRFKNDFNVVADFMGFGAIENSINQAPPIIQPQQSLNAGGQLDIFFKNMPRGTNTNFTPAPKNFMNVGMNSVYAGAN